jgi:glycosyltransferase involved in cell wall biosynthesis
VVINDSFHYNSVKTLGVKIHKISKKIGLRSNNSFKQFYRICTDFKPDIIHTWGNLITLIAIPSSIILKIPIINNQVTATSRVSFLKKMLFYKVPFLFSKYIITNTKYAIRYYGIPSSKAQCIYNGFDYSRLGDLQGIESIKNDLSIKTKYLIGMVASFVPLKDYATYITSAIAVLEYRKDVSFIAIGRGDYSRYESIIPSEYKDRLLLLKERRDIENIMNACDIGVLSSYSEGLPNVVLEFMALGKPVISTPVGGVPELIDENINGFTFEIGESKDLELIINNLLNNPQLRENIGSNAKNKIKESFSSDRMNTEYIELYNKVYTYK